MRTLELFNLKLDKLSSEQLHTIAADFASAASSGSGVLSMFSSYITKRPIPAGIEDMVVTMDIGGSKIRFAIVKFTGSRPEIIKEKALDFPGIETTIGEYVEFIVTNLKSFLAEQGVIDNLGITFSFPAKMIQEHGFIDASREGMGVDWGKGFVVKESEINISKKIRDELASAGINFKHYLTTNDVVALHLAEAEADISVVVGTGFNIGLKDTSGLLFNTESAFFSNQLIQDTFPVPARLYMKGLEEVISKYGTNHYQITDTKKFSEVQISGRYLYRLLINSLIYLGLYNETLVDAILEMESQSISDFLSKDFSRLSKICGHGVNAVVVELLFEICEKLRERSTDLVAAELAGGISYSQPLGTKVVIAADGSLIRNVPAYTDMLGSKIKDLTGKEIEIRLIENSGLLGAAVAIALDLRTKQS